MFRLLVQTDHVATRIVEPQGDFRGVRTDWLHYFAAVCDDRVNRGCDTVHHDLKQQPWRGHGRAAQDPCAAHFASRVVKGHRAVAPPRDPPAENFLVELGTATNVNSGDLDVADFSVWQCRRHAESLGFRNSGNKESSCGRLISPFGIESSHSSLILLLEEKECFALSPI